MSTTVLQSSAYWYARGLKACGSDVSPNAFSIAYVDAYVRFIRVPDMDKAFAEFERTAIITEESIN